MNESDIVAEMIESARRGYCARRAQLLESPEMSALRVVADACSTMLGAALRSWRSGTGDATIQLAGFVRMSIDLARSTKRFYSTNPTVPDHISRPWQISDFSRAVFASVLIDEAAESLVDCLCQPGEFDVVAADLYNGCWEPVVSSVIIRVLRGCKVEEYDSLVAQIESADPSLSNVYRRDLALMQRILRSSGPSINDNSDELQCHREIYMARRKDRYFRDLDLLGGGRNNSKIVDLRFATVLDVVTEGQSRKLDYVHAWKGGGMDPTSDDVLAFILAKKRIWWRFWD